MTVERYASIVDGKIKDIVLWDADEQPDYPTMAELDLMLEADALAAGYETIPPPVFHPDPEPVQDDPALTEARAAINGATTIKGLRTAVLAALDAIGGVQGE